MSRHPAGKAPAQGWERLLPEMERGVLLYPGQGCVDGVRGDHLLVGPPFVITEEQIDAGAGILRGAAAEVTRQV